MKFIDAFNTTIEDLTSTENDETEEDEEEEDEEEDEGINPWLVAGGTAALIGGGYLAYRHFHKKDDEEDSDKKGLVQKFKEKQLKNLDKTLKEERGEMRISIDEYNRIMDLLAKATINIDLEEEAKPEETPAKPKNDKKK